MAKKPRKSATTSAPARKRRPAPKKPARPDATSDFEKAIAGAGKSEHYVLRLYITGSTPRSAAAISNIRKFCEEHLAGRYDLEVIDIYQQPTLAQGEQIIAAPTLIKKLPFPLRKVVGDLSNEERVLMGLDIRPRGGLK
ncbi:MAG: circadian clock KaiB family protein [Phycisphaerae bacterium]